MYTVTKFHVHGHLGELHPYASIVTVGSRTNTTDRAASIVNVRSRTSTTVIAAASVASVVVRVNC